MAAVETKRIAVVTAGHLATCPRMVKAADALAGTGYRVRVISTQFLSWATAADRELRRSRMGSWEWTVVDYTRRSGRLTYWKSGLRHRGAKALARILSPTHAALSTAACAYGRVHSELLRAALSEPADLLYGGTTGALAAIAAAGRQTGVPYALDLEDFHSAEQDDSSSARLAHALARRIEHAILPGAAFLTTGSPAMADAYRAVYAVNPLPLNNTFPLPAAPPDLTPSQGSRLRLYWFSQTVGPRRGLEDAVRAMGIVGLPGELHVRGRAVAGYVERLRHLGAQVAPQLKIAHYEPVVADPIDLCRGYDVGLALEQTHVLNRAVCRTNKSFSYMLAGLAVAFTDTVGQRDLALDLGEGAILYAPGDTATLAAGLKRWAESKTLLARAKAAAWRAAQRRWHWEHPDERGALLNAVSRALNR